MGLLAAVIVFPLLSAKPADADLLPAGKRAASYCVRFTGLESWPEWMFMAYTEYGAGAPYRAETPPQGEEVNLGSCIGIRSLNLGFYDIVLVAVPRKEFSGGFSVADAGAFPRARVRIERGLRKKDEGGLTLTDRVWIDENSKVERVEEVVKVAAVDPAGIVLRKGGSWHVYPDGTIKEIAAKTTSVTWGFAAGVVALLSLAALRAVKRSERRRGGHLPEGS